MPSSSRRSSSISNPFLIQTSDSPLQPELARNRQNNLSISQHSLHSLPTPSSSNHTSRIMDSNNTNNWAKDSDSTDAGIGRDSRTSESSLGADLASSKRRESFGGNLIAFSPTPVPSGLRDGPSPTDSPAAPAAARTTPRRPSGLSLTNPDNFSSAALVDPQSLPRQSSAPDIRIDDTDAPPRPSGEFPSRPRSATVIEIADSPVAPNFPHSPFELPSDHTRRTSISDSIHSITEVQRTRWQRIKHSFWKRRELWISLFKAAILFLISLGGLVLMLYIVLPPIDAEDRPKVKIPKSFDELKALNGVLQVYKERNFSRVLGSFITVYLFLQAFSLPGSMYLSILAGAMYGVLAALPLVCCCVATGALLCYLISAFLGPALLMYSEKWRKRVDKWSERVAKQGGNVISYLIVLRIAPLPPHWVVNMVCPHLGIGIGTFWISTFLGIMGVSFIHTQIGTTLDQMTSAKDFHLISWRNFFGLAGVVVAVMVPVAIRYAWRSELAEAATDEEERAREQTEEGVEQTEGDAVEADSKTSKSHLVYLENDDTASYIGNSSIHSVESMTSLSTSFSSDADYDDDDDDDDPRGGEDQPFIKNKSSSSSNSKDVKDTSGNLGKKSVKEMVKDVVFPSRQKERDLETNNRRNSKSKGKGRSRQSESKGLKISKPGDSGIAGSWGWMNGSQPATGGEGSSA